MYNLLLDCLIVVWLLLYYCWFVVGLLDFCLLLDFCWVNVGLLLDYCLFVVVTCSWYPPTMVMLASTMVMPSLLAALHRYSPPSDNWTARILGDRISRIRGQHYSLYISLNIHQKFIIFIIIYSHFTHWQWFKCLWIKISGILSFLRVWAHVCPSISTTSTSM